MTDPADNPSQTNQENYQSATPTRRFRKSSSGRSRSSFRKTAFDPTGHVGHCPRRDYTARLDALAKFAQALRLSQIAQTIGV